MTTNAARLFRASQVALIVTAMSFALRSTSAEAWSTDFNISHEKVGWVAGSALWGFTVAMVLGGPLCDWVGLKTITMFALVGHVVGILLTVFARDYGTLFAGNLIFGIANGSVEAACNPLIATLYPEDKTTKLNHFHAWFPGGIVLGTLLAYALSKGGIGWRAQFGCLLIPTAIYAFMFLGQAFPKTERVEKGVSTSSMWAACFHPLFLLMVACMLFTAATEFGPQSWIPAIVDNAKVGVSGALVLTFITALMWGGRQIAGVFVHRVSAPGMLFLSAVLATAGLLIMSRFSHNSPVMLFVAAAIFAFGVCFFWPTMLGTVSERFPKTGALGLAIMGGAGMLSASFIVPLVGRFYDTGIQSRLAAGETIDAFKLAPADSPVAAHWTEIQAGAGLEALGKVAVLPGALAVVFLLLFILWRKPKAQA
ncbi:MAG TPA: MFS transporter [Opitutaceae bacterium]|nr:MFS transporter [Opitutaceae bacterium]